MSDESSNQARELKELLGRYTFDKHRRYQRAPWLLSEPGDPVWRTSLLGEIEIDWRVPLSDGALLTSSKHSRLLESLQSWLIAPTHPDAGGDRIRTTASERNIVQIGLTWIDAILIHHERLDILAGGLGRITDDRWRALAGLVTSHPSTGLTVYQWPSKLSSYLREKVSHLSDTRVANLLEDEPALEQLAQTDRDSLTDLSTDEVIRAKCWLFEAGHLLHADRRREGFHYPNLRNVISEIYPTTVWARHRPFQIPPELCVSTGMLNRREYPRARITARGGNALTSNRALTLLRPLASLPLLAEDGIDAPVAEPLDISSFVNKLVLSRGGRFRTLPQATVLTALRRGIELTLELGDDIVDSYLRVAEDAHSRGISLSSPAYSEDIRSLLTQKLVDAGMRKWSLVPPSFQGRILNAPIKSVDYFRDLRSGIGLAQMVRVLFGATQIVTGTLMARRQAELVELQAGQCFDESRTRLLFRNRKAGIGSLRPLIARPIPEIAVDSLARLERLQEGLIRIGAIKAYTSIFSPPKTRGKVGLVRLNSHVYNCNLDIFCDWSETPLDKDGRRFYIRQHQLRRFFAMLFFYGGGFGGLETLRWFLGHADPAHLWHYITESTPGATIRSIAAEWATKSLVEGNSLNGLEEIVLEHFQTRDFSILEEEVISTYVEHLLSEGTVAIEPEFLDNGRSYRIAVVICPSPGHEIN